jgi:hypothetical protein
VPTGGTTGQTLQKATAADYDTQWVTPAPGGVTSFNTRTGAVSLTTGDVTGALTYTPVAPTRSVLAGTGLTGGGDLSADRTLSLPAVGAAGTYGDATHFPVVTTDAQGRVTGVTTQVVSAGSTLPVPDTTALVAGSADATKLLRFEVDGFTAATTRVLTPPDQDGTLAVLERAQTFTKGPQTIQVDAAANKGLVVKAAASPTGNLFEAQDSTGAAGARVDSSLNFSRPTAGLANSEQFGAKSTVTAANGVSLGYQCTAGSNAIAVGFVATASGTQSIALGNATASGIASFALGTSASASANGALALGQSASATGTGAIAIGRAAAAGANEFVSGCPVSQGFQITNVYFGSGKTDAAPVSYTINGTGGSGTDVAGGTLNLAGGRGTGTGAGGNVVLRVAPAGTTGTALNALVDVVTISPATQNVLITATAPGLKGLVVKATTSPTANRQEWQDSAGTPDCTVSENGYFTTRKTAAPADAELSNSEVALWLDATAGRPWVRWKAKDSAGTVFAGRVPLNPARAVLADGATVTVDASLGGQQEVTLGGNRTVAFANWVDGDEVKFDVIQDGTGSRTLTWPTVRWAGGSAPTLTTAAGKIDTVVLRRRGTEYLGYLAGTNL